MLFLPPFCRQQEIEGSEELGANARISAVRLLDPTLPNSNDLLVEGETTKGLQGGPNVRTYRGPYRGIRGSYRGATGKLQGIYGSVEGSYRGRGSFVGAQQTATPCPDQPDPSQGLSSEFRSLGSPRALGECCQPPPVTGKNAMTFNARLGQTSLHNSDCITNSLSYTHARIENTQSDETVSSSFVQLLVRTREPPLTTLNCEEAVLTRTQDTDTRSLKLSSVDDNNKRRTSAVPIFD
ncbi:hypothetical protein E4U16_007106 [Claviceps sp. LM84 group G4]|nr:hypothetical protein E4U16_007106 [Claviceps sp. LM84 group G4]